MRDVIVRAALLAGAAALYPPLPAFSQQSDSLSISGAPATCVQVGEAYAFTPHAVAVGPISPHFEVQNLPQWASFGWSGQLAGSPTAADVGTYSNIVISIVAGTEQASLPVFSITVAPASGPNESATLSWTPPTTNVDGSALTNLAGYRVYAGTAPDHLAPVLTLDNAGLTCQVVDGLTRGLNYFAMTAVNSRGDESLLSSVVSVTL